MRGFAGCGRLAPVKARIGWLVLLLLGSLIAGRGAEEMSVEVYPLGQTDFEMAAKMADTMVSPGGKLLADKAGNRLILYDTAEKHEALRRALSGLKTPLRHVRIRVTFQDRDILQSGGVEVEGRTSVGPVTIETGPRKPGSSVSVRARQSNVAQSSLVQQELWVISGGKARLVVATEVPYADWFWNRGLRWGLWSGAVRWKEVGAQMRVEPYVMENRIRIRLTPEFSYVLDGERLTTAVEKLTTEVVVRDGEEIDLGGLPVADRDFYSRFLVGASYLGEKRSLNIRLLPKIE